MLQEINPPAVIRQVEDEKSAQQWHLQAINAEKKRSAGTLEQSEAWYNLKETEGYRELGYRSIADYVFKEFSKSGKTADKYIQIYRVLVVELKRPMEELINIGAGKLAKIISHVTPENVDQILSDVANMSQEEISERIKEESPLEKKPGDDKMLKFKGPSVMVDVLIDSMRTAKEEIVNMSSFQNPDDVPDLAAMNHICATYSASVDMDGNPVNTLETSLRNLESAFGVSISWEEKEEEV